MWLALNGDIARYYSRFVVASFGRNRSQTPVIKKTLNPNYAPKDATFDFPIYRSLADRIGALELVVWDKDMLKKDYLGEVAFMLDDLKDCGALAFDDRSNEVCSNLCIYSIRAFVLSLEVAERIHIPPLTATHAEARIDASIDSSKWDYHDQGRFGHTTGRRSFPQR